jgi:hypothetical protein
MSQLVRLKVKTRTPLAVSKINGGLRRHCAGGPGTYERPRPYGQRPGRYAQAAARFQDEALLPICFRCVELDKSCRLAATSRHSTVTLFARLRGWSTSVPRIVATW